jgi:hypothetical protein
MTKALSMVRLVFRPYTQIWRSICTSESLRASTRVSPGFTLFRHSSPSFGSQQTCSYSNLSKYIKIGRWCGLLKEASHLRSLSLRVWVCHPNTRMYVRLLGPCFKTGHLKPLSQRPKTNRIPNESPLKMNPSQQAVWGSFRSSNWVRTSFADLSPSRRISQGYNTPKSHIPLSFFRQPKLTLACATEVWPPADKNGFKRFPFNNFTYCLTLFSKFFSSFPHGTCSLSVSRWYLALDEIYHPF